MKRTFLLKMMLLLCALVAGSSSVWGANYTGTFTKITSTNDFVTGYYVVAASESASSNAGYALGNSVNSDKRITGQSITITSGTTITNPSDAIVWYITVSGTTITMKNVNNDKYLYQANNQSGKGMGLTNSSHNLTFAGYNSTSPIGFKFTLNGTSNNLFKYNSGSKWFANYANDYTTSMTPVRLFKLEVTKTDPTIIATPGSTCVGRKLDLNTLFDSDSPGDFTYTITSTSGGGNAEIEGSFLTGTAVGTVTIKGSQAAAGDYNSKDATTTITINEAVALSNIEITTEPTTTEYVEGQFFDPKGMVVTATYADNTTYEVTSFCTYSPALTTALTPSDTFVEISYIENGETKTANQAITVLEDIAILPFKWDGGVKADLIALLGVTGSGLGNDYAEGNAPYRVRFDSNDDYILINTKSQPGKVSVGIKIFENIGANAGTKITIQGSSDGTTFSNVEEFSLNGKEANTTYTLTTTKSFNLDDRYVKMLFTKGSGQNCGVGPISIAIPEAADPVVSGETVTLTTTENMDGWRTFYDADQGYTADTNTKVYVVSKSTSEKVTLVDIGSSEIPAGTPVILKTTDTAHQITLTKANVDTFDGTNELQASTAGQNLGTVYRLGYGGNGVGFYKYVSSSAAAGIVYVSSLGDTSAPSLSIEIGSGSEATSIEAIKSKIDKHEVHNLAGQRIAKPTKGLYIVNGKKYVVK